MNKLFRFTWRAVLGLLLGWLVLVALATGLTRWWWLPGIAAFRPELEAGLGALLGESLRIESLSARLHGFYPELSLRGLEVLGPDGRPTLRFETVRARLDPLRTLEAGEPRFQQVEIVGSRLSIRRREDGSLTLVGLTTQTALPAWLWADGRIELRAAELDWQDAKTRAPPLPLGRAEIRLRNLGDRHRLEAVLAPPPAVGRSLRLTLDGVGGAGDWRGLVYVEAKGLDLVRFSASFPVPPRLGVQGGTADARLWLHWQDGWRAVTGEVAVTAPRLAIGDEAGALRPLAAQALTGRFFWRREGAGWRLDLTRFRPVFRAPWPETRLALAVERSAAGALASLRLAASYLDLADLTALLPAFPAVDPALGNALVGLSPQGTLRAVRFYYAPAAPPGGRVAVCGRFRDLAFRPWHNVPGGVGFRGRLCGSDGGGRATVSADGGQLLLPALGIRVPLPLTWLRTTLSWEQGEGEWRLTVPALSLRNPDLAARGQGRLILAKGAGRSPFLDFRLRVANAQVAALPRYAPAALMPSTARWLAEALVGGRLRRGDLLFHGFTGAFPFHRNEGVFQAELQLQDLALRYHPEWPPLRQAEARIQFRGPGATAELRRGRIGEGDIVAARGEAEDLSRPSWLRIAGKVRAGVGEVLDFLAQSPLRAIPERLRKFARPAGQAEIAIGLRVPLDAALGETAVEGTVTLRRAGLRIDSLGLAVRDLEGPLRFSAAGVRAAGLRARILDRPARIDVAPEGRELRLGVYGEASVAALQAQFPADWWHHARGAADYHLDLRLPKTLDAEGAPWRLALDSDLAGIALDLPAPLGKPAAAVRGLTVEATLRSGAALPVRLRYGGDLEIRARFSEPARGLRLEGGEIALGRPLPPVAGAPGLGLRVRLERLDAGAWWRWWAAQPGIGPGLERFRELDLEIGQLDWHREALGPVALRLRREGDVWRGRVEGGRGGGELYLGPDALRLALETLHLPARWPEWPAASVQASPALDPAQVPALEVEVKRLRWGGVDLGPLQLNTQRRAQGMIIQRLTLGDGDRQLELKGHWLRPPGQAASTHVEGRVRLRSLGDFLAALGRDGVIRDTATELRFALDWPGAPPQWSLAAMAGELAVNLGRGGLLQIEPGLGRVIGMLNLDSLWRRLVFDFSDLFGRGLAYDGVAGTFRLGGGQAVTDGLSIDALSARILVTGRIGLVARDLDQRVTVVPRASAALPIAGALAGGPAVGAAIYVAQRLIGEEVDSITATQYAVHGPWDDPVITRVHRDLPLDMLERAWSGIRDLSGFDSEQEERR